MFAVDTSKLLDIVDVKYDGLGARNCMGSPKFYYLIDQESKSHKHDNPDDCPTGHILYIVQHQYFSNKSLPSLRKSLISARQAAATLPQDLIIVQYIFGEGEQEVTVKSHGISKGGAGSRAFKQTIFFIMNK